MKKRQSQPKKNDDKPVTLGDMLNEDLVKKLREQKQQLKEAEEKKLLAEEEKKREERRLREKNKSFEELLNESPMDWHKYK